MQQNTSKTRLERENDVGGSGTHDGYVVSVSADEHRSAYKNV